jgi:TonB family protein
MDAVTQILLERSERADNLTRMMVVSLVAHAAIVTVVTLLPRQWGTPRDNTPVMTITLSGGAPGPIQGRNAMSGRQIQEAVPETVKPRNDTAPAPVKPEMVEPLKAAKPEPKRVARPEPKKEEPPRGRTPTQGAEVKPGVARIDTQGAPTPFGGFATGGGAAGTAYTDFADFCCPEYLARMQTMIYGNWQQRQGVEGSNIVKFTIARDGTISAVVIEQGGNEFLNRASQRAVALTQQLPPLPTAFTPPQLTVHLVFQYKR